MVKGDTCTPVVYSASAVFSGTDIECTLNTYGIIVFGIFCLFLSPINIMGTVEFTLTFGSLQYTNGQNVLPSLAWTAIFNRKYQINTQTVAN